MEIENLMSLESWIKNAVETPIEILNLKYSEDQIVRDELDNLPLPKDSRGYTVEASRVSNENLTNLHQKILGEDCEKAIWDAVVWYLSHPLPISTAHDLIDRSISIAAMAFTRQTDEVQWRLATLVEDALYTLISERYQLPQYSTTQFETMLKMYVMRNDGVLHMLSFRKPSSSEKEAVYLAAVEQEKARLNQLGDDVE